MAGQRLQRQQHGIWIIPGCCLIMLIIYFFSLSGVTAISRSSQGRLPQDNSAIVRPSSQPILPRGYGIPATVRDVFAIPTEFRPVFAALPAAAPERKNTADILSSGQAAEPPAIPLVLVGIISGGGQKVAIIKYAGGSRSYRINDFIGPYQLIAIESAATVLLGPKGRSTLLLELER